MQHGMKIIMNDELGGLGKESVCPFVKILPNILPKRLKETTTNMSREPVKLLNLVRNLMKCVFYT
jgi:hypothetical protein